MKANNNKVAQVRFARIDLSQGAHPQSTRVPLAKASWEYAQKAGAV
jgi:hypothetical protein